MSATVLILSYGEDSHARHVTQLLTSRGAEVVVFDATNFPQHGRLSAKLSPDGAIRRHLRLPARPGAAQDEERLVDLDALAAVWFRRPAEPAPDAACTDQTRRQYVQQECAAFTADIWDGLDCRAVPAVDAVTRYAARKISQLVEAGRLGFELPPTLVTTDPDEFLDFYRAHDGRVITKVLEQLGAYRLDDDFFRFTEPVSTRDVGFFEAIRECPVIVQPHLPKALELRVTVVGDRVFAAEIHSQASHHARLDWRRSDRRMTPYARHDLPAATAERCQRLLARLGLCYGAIDLILTPEGRYVFLEVNPSGQYLWVEKATGLPISEALCELLLGHEAPSYGLRPPGPLTSGRHAPNRRPSTPSTGARP